MTIREFILVLVLAAGTALAQVNASISGRVTDVTGGGVRNVTVTVKSIETGAVRTTKTDESGNYSVLSLPLGAQEVRAVAPGFNEAVRKGINLTVGQEAVVNLTLEIGTMNQEVTVTEEAPVVNTTTSAVSGVVGAREVKDLPLNGRSFDSLIALNPGAVEYNLKSANTSTSNGLTFTVSGRRPSDNLVLLNGIEYTGSSQLAITPGGVSGYLLGIDAVREFNVLTDTYPADYGKRSGAQVSVVTQSGTNELHGSLFEFFRNSALDAKNYFDQGSIPPLRRNQFGGALGGPLRKNRLFLFGNYEGFRYVQALSNVTVAPDAQARLGLLPNSAGVYTKVVNLDAAMLNYMPFWPDPNGPELLIPGSNLPSGTALSYNHPRQPEREDFGTTRFDYDIGDRDIFSAAYTIDDGDSQIPQADPLFGAALGLRNQVASLQEVHIFSPEMLNTFRFGFSRGAFNYGALDYASFPASLDFVTGEGPGGIVIGGGTSTTGIAAITSAGPNNAANVWNRRNLYTESDTFQINKGIHQISAGVWMQRMQDNEDTASRALGQATFSTLTTFLQGTASTFQVVPDPTELGWRSLFGAWFIEDTIKARRNLTIQLGIRQEFTTGWNEVEGRASNYIANSAGVLETAPLVGNSVFTQNNATRLFGPRAGLAWDVFGNGKTAVRAGFGTYYSLIDDLAFLQNALPPYNGAATYSGALSSFLPITPGVQPPSTTVFAPQGIQANAKTPTVEEWNFRIEQQLGGNTALRVAYVGSFGFHGLVSVDPNSIPAEICASATCPSGGNAKTTSTVTEGMQYIPIGKLPNPNLSAAFFWYTEGNSSYNALQVDVTHRLSHGLQLRANFTWSKNLDINSAPTGAQASNQAQMVMDINDLHRDWGPSALNVTAQGSISARYELPFGHGRQFLGNAGGWEERLLGGWQLNGIATLLSGFPFTPLDGSNVSGDGDTRNPDRPSLVPGFSGPIVTGNPNQWFNPLAFALPTAGTYGNLGRGALIGPGLAELDMSLFKSFAVAEKASLQFRTEIFNVMNRANFASPNTTVFANGAVSPTAGLISGTVTTSRQLQFGLKLIF